MEGCRSLEGVCYADSLLPYSYSADGCCETKPCEHHNNFSSTVVERPFVPALDGSSNFLAIDAENASSSQCTVTAIHSPISPDFHIPSLHLIETPALGAYTPGYLASAHAQVDPYCVVSTATPTTTMTSMYEEDFDPIHINSCVDFLGAGLSEIRLVADPKHERLTQELIDGVHNRGFKAAQSNIEHNSIEAALEAIHTSMCFYHHPAQDRLPLTIDQLRTLLLRQRQKNTSSEFPDFSALAKLLDMCHLQSGESFNMGVIEPMFDRGDYQLHIHLSKENSARETLWLFHNFQFGNLQNQWLAIVPDFDVPKISYAAAVLAPNCLPYCPPTEPTKPFLYPPDKSFLLADSTGRSMSFGRISRRRSGPDSHSAHHRATRVSRRPAKPSSECGSKIYCNKCKKPLENQIALKQHQKKCEEIQKNHACDICQARFLYPKDLKRHRNTHNGAVSFMCDHCPKEYSRRDNLLRHIKYQHKN